MLQLNKKKRKTQKNQFLLMQNELMSKRAKHMVGKAGFNHQTFLSDRFCVTSTLFTVHSITKRSALN